MYNLITEIIYSYNWPNLNSKIWFIQVNLLSRSLYVSLRNLIRIQYLDFEVYKWFGRYFSILINYHTTFEAATWNSEPIVEKCKDFKSTLKTIMKFHSLSRSSIFLLKTQTTIKSYAGTTLVPALWLRTKLCFAAKPFHRISTQISFHLLGDSLTCMILREQTKTSIRTIISTSIHSSDMGILNSSSMFCGRPMWIIPIMSYNRIIAETNKMSLKYRIRTKSKSNFKLNGNKTLRSDFNSLPAMTCSKTTYNKTCFLEISEKKISRFLL